MRHTDYEQVDIYSPKSFLSNISPQSASNNSTIGKNKPRQQLLQRPNSSQTAKQPNQRPPSADLQNKENISSSLSKIFFNSPRYNGKGQEVSNQNSSISNQNQKPAVASTNSSYQSQSVLQPTNTNINGNYQQQQSNYQNSSTTSSNTSNNNPNPSFFAYNNNQSQLSGSSHQTSYQQQQQHHHHQHHQLSQPQQSQQQNPSNNLKSSNRDLSNYSRLNEFQNQNQPISNTSQASLASNIYQRENSNPNMRLSGFLHNNNNNTSSNNHNNSNHNIVGISIPGSIQNNNYNGGSTTGGIKFQNHMGGHSNDDYSDHQATKTSIILSRNTNSKESGPIHNNYVNESGRGYNGLTSPSSVTVNNPLSSNYASPKNRPMSGKHQDDSNHYQDSSHLSDSIKQIRYEHSVESLNQEYNNRRALQNSSKNISQIAAGESKYEEKRSQPALQSESLETRKTVFSGTSNFSQRPFSTKQQISPQVPSNTSSSQVFSSTTNIGASKLLSTQINSLNSTDSLQSRPLTTQYQREDNSQHYQKNSTIFHQKEAKQSTFFNERQTASATPSHAQLVQSDTPLNTETNINNSGKSNKTKSRTGQDDYHEYKKLQEKLSYLENQIMSIKTNIDSTYNREDKGQQSGIHTNVQSQPASASTTVGRFVRREEASNSLRNINSNTRPTNYYDNLSSNPCRESSVIKDHQSNRYSDDHNSLKTSILGATGTVNGSQIAPSTNTINTNRSRGVSQEPSKTSSLSSFITQVKLGGGIPTTSNSTNTSSGGSSSINQNLGNTGTILTTNTSIRDSSKKSSNTNITSSINKHSSNEKFNSNTCSPTASMSPNPSAIGTGSAVIPQSYLNRTPQSTTNSNNGGKAFAFGQNETSESEKENNSHHKQNIDITLPGSSLRNSTIITNNVQNGEHLLQTMQAMTFTQVLKPPSQKTIQEKRVFLTKKQYYRDKKTLVFDLDETLIHCNESTAVPADVILPIKFPTGEVIEAGINIRPYTMQCLQELSKIYELVIFTASHSCYANVVLDYLDPTGIYFQHRLFRENCVNTDEGVYIKDLRVIANRNMSELIIVDNAAYSFGFQVDNGIPILPFYDNQSDTELKHLINYMKLLNNGRDIREMNRKMLQMSSFGDFQDPIELLQTLFQDYIK